MDKEKLVYLDEVCIGMQEMCSILNVTPNTIRNYEKKAGLPVRKTENGYRFFFFNDIQRCLTIRKYIALGFSVADAGKMTFHSDYSDVSNKLSSQKPILEEEIARLEKKLQILKEIEKQHRELLSLENRIEIAERPECYWLPITSKSEVLAKYNPSVYQNWIDAIPFAFPSARVLKGEMHREAVAQSGLICLQEYVNQGLTIPEGQHYASCKALKTIVKAQVKDDYYSLMNHIFTYAKEHHLIITDDILSILVGSDMAMHPGEERYDYYITYAPFEEEN